MNNINIVSYQPQHQPWFESGAGQIVLYSQTGLKTAIALYEKLGFKPVAIEAGKYKRADTKMVIDIKDAIRSINNFSTNTQTQKICV